MSMHFDEVYMLLMVVEQAHKQGHKYSEIEQAALRQLDEYLKVATKENTDAKKKAEVEAAKAKADAAAKEKARADAEAKATVKNRPLVPGVRARPEPEPDPDEGQGPIADSNGNDSGRRTIA